MEIHNISLENSVAHNFMAEIRDIDVQSDRLRFRKNLARLGEILAYEMSKSLDYKQTNITTPLVSMSQNVIKNQPVLISILRAGMPFFEGIQNFFDRADAGFVGGFRASDFSTSNRVELSYFAVPDLNDKIVVLADPMLASGRSIVDSIAQLIKFGSPKKIFLLVVIAAPEGIRYIEDNIQLPIELWCGALDDKLNDRSYIVPGLGDAGDLAYGPKL